jgi:lipoprotein signal peptidase
MAPLLLASRIGSGVERTHPSDRGSIGGRRTVLVATACLVAATDLAHKAAVATPYHHLRPFGVAGLAAGLILALVVFVPRLPSRAASLGAGLAAGGALGNLVSVLAWTQGVPDPLVVAGARYGIAFNLADVSAVVGDAMLVSAAVVYGLRNRSRLREPV